MGFFKKIGKAVVKGVNSVAGTNLSIGKSEGSDSSNTKVEDIIFNFVEKGVQNLTGSAIDEAEKGLNKLLGGSKGTNNTNKLADTLGGFGSKILDSTLSQWLKKNWYFLLIPIPIGVAIYYFAGGKQASKKTKSKKWF